MSNRLEPGVLVLAILLAGCGGGGGGGNGGGSPPPATYALTGTVSGLDGSEVLLAVAGKADVSVAANGSVALASGLANGAAYAVTVKTQPTLQLCTVTNGTGNVAGANVNVLVNCARAPVTLAISAPANNDLVPLNGARTVTATIAGTLPDALNWEVLTSGMPSDATVTPVSSSPTGAVVEFQATVPGAYTLRLTSDDDVSKSAEITLRVHTEYTAIDSLVQGRIYLQADGTVHSEDDGAPSEPMQAVAQGHRYGVAVRMNGTVTSWGLTTAAVPADLAQVKRVAAGAYYSAALLEDDTLVLWGRIGANDAQVPASLATAKFKAVEPTLTDVAAILEDGTLVAWDGQWGTLKSLPSDWQGRKFTQLCGTNAHVLAIDEAGTLHSWNLLTSQPSALDTPPVTTTVSAVYCGSDHAALMQANGRVMTWGDDLGGNGPFDSTTVPGFPRIKGAAFWSYGDPRFLTETGAIVDREGNVIMDVDVDE